MSRTLLAIGLTLVVIAQSALASEGSAPKPVVRDAIQRSLTYLTKEGVAWKKQQQCASCHHIPFTAWALNEARDHGYAIDQMALDDLQTWALDQKKHSQVFPDLPLDKKHTETDYLGPLLMALGVGAAQHRTEAQEAGRQRLLAHALTQQASDGSWYCNSKGGRPPIHSTPDVLTSLLFLALSDPGVNGDAQDPFKAARAGSAQWLSHNPPADSHQARVMRLLVNQRLSKDDGENATLLQWLLAHQNEDGGWSQTPQMKSDAFATGLTLYALSGQRRSDALDQAVGRAIAFLLKTQLPDGSWAMASRHAEPTGPGPAHDLHPIQYIGTAVATIGLVRSVPNGSKSAGAAAAE